MFTGDVVHTDEEDSGILVTIEPNANNELLYYSFRHECICQAHPSEFEVVASDNLAHARYVEALGSAVSALGTKFYNEVTHPWAIWRDNREHAKVVNQYAKAFALLTARVEAEVVR